MLLKLSSFRATAGNETTEETLLNSTSFNETDPSAPALWTSLNPSKDWHITIFPFANLLSIQPWPSVHNLRCKTNSKFLFVCFMRNYEELKWIIEELVNLLRVEITFAWSWNIYPIYQGKRFPFRRERINRVTLLVYTDCQNAYL